MKKVKPDPPYLVDFFYMFVAMFIGLILMGLFAGLLAWLEDGTNIFKEWLSGIESALLIAFGVALINETLRAAAYEGMWDDLMNLLDKDLYDDEDHKR